VLIKRAKECAWALVGFLLFASDLRAASATGAAPKVSLQPG
jgi:hypothetical protein